MATLLALLLIELSVYAVLYVWSALALSAVFRKAGVPTWAAWVPLYQYARLFRLGGVGGGWAVFLLVAGFIGRLYMIFSAADSRGMYWFGAVIAGAAGLLWIIVFAIVLTRVNRGFGLGAGWTVLGILLTPVWASIVGWGPAQWGSTRFVREPAAPKAAVAAAPREHREPPRFIRAVGAGIQDLGKMFGGAQSSGRQFGILGALVVIIIVFQIWTGGKTLEPGNLLNLVNGNAYVLILAIGMVMVIIAGHIDLSVGSVAAFVGIIVAIAVNDWHFPWPLGLLLGIMVGVVVGAWQGFWVAYVGVPAFIVTLAGMLIFRGANQFVGNSTSLGLPKDNTFGFIGTGYLWDPAWGVPLNLTTVLIGLVAIAFVIVREVLLRRRQLKQGADHAPLWVSIVKVALLVGIIAAAAYLFASGPVGTSFPVSGVILGVLVIGYAFFTNRTVLGRHIYAIGGNWRAAELSGVKIRRVNFFVIMNMSIIASIAGMMWVARAGASGPGDGVGWELDAISAVFIGGAAVSGGIGTVIGSIIGGLVIAVLNNGLSLQGVSSDKVQIIKGLVLLLAVGIDVLSKRGGRPSIIGRLRFGRRPVAADVTADSAAVLPTGDAPEATSRSGATTPNS